MLFNRRVCCGITLFQALLLLSAASEVGRSVEASSEVSETLKTTVDIQVLDPYRNRQGSIRTETPLRLTHSHTSEAHYNVLLGFDAPNQQVTKGRAVERISLRLHGAVCSQDRPRISVFVSVLYRAWSIASISKEQLLPESLFYSQFELAGEESNSRWQEWQEFVLWPHDLARDNISPNEAVDNISRHGLMLSLPHESAQILSATCAIDSSRSGFGAEVIVRYRDCPRKSCTYLPVLSVYTVGSQLSSSSDISSDHPPSNTREFTLRRIAQFKKLASPAITLRGKSCQQAHLHLRRLARDILG